jgi:hypothetical protein
VRDITLEAEFAENDLVFIHVWIGNLKVTVLAEALLEGSKLTLRGTHFDGPGPNTVGIEELRKIANRIAEATDVETVVVEGAVRTTGAAPGHQPRTLRFRRAARSGPA